MPTEEDAPGDGVRDWSLITGRGGGATKWENRGSETF